MPIIRCPHCDDRVEIEDDWYGRRIACPSCEREFTPQRGGREDREDDRPRGRSSRDDRDDDRGSPDRRYRPDRDDDDRPRPRRRGRYDNDPPKKRNTVLWIVLALVGVFVILPCVGCVGFVMWAGSAKQSFDGPWADVAVGSNAEVTASFPKTPSSKFINVSGSTGGEMTGFSNVNDANNPLDVELAVGYVDYPPGTTGPIEKGYAEIKREVEDVVIDSPVVRPKVQKETSTTVNGYPAKEATYTEETGGYTLRVIHVNDRPKGATVRLVVVLAGGNSMKPEDKQKFLNSVRIGKK